MVTILIMVVINVVKDTKSGSVSNCKANIVVFAAAGIADCKIMTARNKSLTGMKYKMTAATSGEATIRMTVTAVRNDKQLFFG